MRSLSYAVNDRQDSRECVRSPGLLWVKMASVCYLVNSGGAYASNWF